MRVFVFRLAFFLTLLWCSSQRAAWASIINVSDPISHTEAYSFVEHTEVRDSETDYTADASTSSIASGDLGGNSTSCTAEHVRTVTSLNIDVHGHASASSFHMMGFDGIATATSGGSLFFEVDVPGVYRLFGDMLLVAQGDAASFAQGAFQIETDSATLVLDGDTVFPETDTTYPFSYLVSLSPGVTYDLGYSFNVEAPSANDTALANVIYSLQLESVPEPSAGWLACAGATLCISLWLGRRRFVVS